VIKLITFLALLTFSIFGHTEQSLPDTEYKVLKESLQEWILNSYPKNISESTANIVSTRILHESSEGNINLELLVGLISVESEFKTKAVSREGAKGLMQVIPKWHHDKIKGRQLFDPQVALEVGSIILKDCLNSSRYNTRKALACFSGNKISTVNGYYKKVMAKANLFRNHLTLVMFMRNETQDPLPDPLVVAEL